MNFVTVVLFALCLVFVLSWSSNPIVRWVFRTLLLLFGLGCLVVAAACFCLPIFKPASGAGILMLVAIFPGGLGLMALYFWAGTLEAEEFHDLDDHGKREFTRRAYEEARASTEQSIARKEGRADSVFTGSGERSRLNREIGAEERNLRGLDAMHRGYEEHMDRKEQGLPEKDFRTRLREAFKRLREMFRPPRRR